MAELDLRTHSSLVGLMASAIQGRAKALIDFSIGSLLRATSEADAGMALWLQGLALRILARARASTSSGADLDSWVQDFGVYRLGAQQSDGTVTFSRYTPGAQAVIPLGATIQTADGSEDFIVVLDSSHASYNAGLQGYVLPVNVASISVPVRAQRGGLSGNVLAGTVTVITSQILYVDEVTNAEDFAGGGDEETDDQLRQRFIAFIASLSKATRLAVAYAIMSLKRGLTYSIVENYTLDDTWTPGFFFVVVDDGSGYPSSALISDVFAAVDAVRAATVTCSVHAPVVMTAGVSMTLTVKQGYDPNVVKGDVGTAIAAYINALPVGASLQYTKVAQLAYEASAGVDNVTALLVGGSAADLVAEPRNKIIAGVMVVN